MHLMYGVANGNASKTDTLYELTFEGPSSRSVNIHRRLWEKRSFAEFKQNVKGMRNVKTLDEDILIRMGDQPGHSTRELSRVTCPNDGCYVLQDEGIHPNRMQKVEGLSPANYQLYVNFARWHLHQKAAYGFQYICCLN